MSDGIQMKDFAGALRQMANDADWLAERHDVADMADLRRQVHEQAVKARRDSDLIDELRRQLAAMGRSLDAISRLRRNAQIAPADKGTVIKVLAEALLVIDGPCDNYIPDSWTCRTEGVGRTRGARYSAEAWCVQCVARDALERAGALPPAVD